MSSVLAIRGLEKAYGRHHALRGLDLTVASGDVYGFLGRNGAGKSTTIRIVMGITLKSAGQVELFGKPSDRDVVAARQSIGYVAQEQNFYGWMTPVVMSRFVRGFFPTWDEAEWNRVAKRLELPLDRKIGGFSGGTRVKLALALALAHRPPLLLLDEPTAGLDPVARREFLDIVREENRASGRTTFFSSHLVDEIERVSTKIGVVDGGKTRFEGTKDELLERVRFAQVPRAVPRGEVEVLLATAGVRLLHAEDAALSKADAGDDVALYLELAPIDRRTTEAEVFEHALAELVRAHAPDASVTLDRLPLEEAFIAFVRHTDGHAP